VAVGGRERARGLWKKSNRKARDEQDQVMAKN